MTLYELIKFLDCSDCRIWKIHYNSRYFRVQKSVCFFLGKGWFDQVKLYITTSFSKLLIKKSFWYITYTAPQNSYVPNKHFICTIMCHNMIVFIQWIMDLGITYHYNDGKDIIYIKCLYIVWNHILKGKLVIFWCATII